MKKIIAFILALTMIFTLCACGDGVNPGASDSQGLANKETLPGLWLCTDEIYDGYVGCAFFSTDGYAYWEYYDLTDEDDFDCLNNIIECIRNDCSSSAIEKICEYEYGEYCGIEELYQAAELAVGKYNARKGEVTISYSDGAEDTGSFDSEISILKLTDYYDGHNYTFEKYDYYLDDSYRYFVGNWNVSYVEYHPNSDDYYSLNYMLSLGENLKFDISTGYRNTDTDNWSYMNGELKIGEHHRAEEDVVEGTTVKLSYNRFAVFYPEEKGDGSYRYYSWIFERA